MSDVDMYLHNVRRMLKRGLCKAQHDYLTYNSQLYSDYVDMFQHCLDELERAGIK